MELFYWLVITASIAIPLYLLLKPEQESRTPIYRVRPTRSTMLKIQRRRIK